MITVTGAMLAAKALQINLAFAGADIHETYSHDESPQIDKIEAEWGLRGLAYCNMGEGHVCTKALMELTNRDPANTAIFDHVLHTELQRWFLPSPSCGASVTDARTRGKWTANPAELLPGDLVFFDWTGRHGAAEHVGMIRQVLRPSQPGGHVIARTVEWNTKPTGAGNQSDGGGCYCKVRDLTLYAIGGIRINRPVPAVSYP